MAATRTTPVAGQANGRAPPTKTTAIATHGFMAGSIHCGAVGRHTERANDNAAHLLAATRSARFLLSLSVSLIVRQCAPFTNVVQKRFAFRPNRLYCAPVRDLKKEVE